jgi:predicted  nucleic acid-binding Zn-ribbon protein
MTRYPALLLCAMLSGCVLDHGDQGDIHVSPPVVPVAPVSSVTPDDLSKVERSLTDRINATSNAAQQSFSGLGAQIAKGAENVDAAIAKIQTDIRVQATAQAEANVAVRNDVRATADVVTDLKVRLDMAVQVMTQLDVNVKAQAQAIVDLKNDVQALGAAQVGLRNELQQTTNNLSAGRDTIQLMQGSAKELVEIVKDQTEARVKATYIICGCLVAIVTALLEFSRRRAEARANR